MNYDKLPHGTPVLMSDREQLGELVGTDENYLEVKSTAEGNPIHVPKSDVDFVTDDGIVLALDMDEYTDRQQRQYVRG